MNKKIKNLAAVCAAALLVTSCSITGPVAVSSNPVGKKVGEAKATIILGFCFGGDYSIQTAAKNGGITRISTVDVKTFNALGVYVVKKAIVTGE
jgi:hypothetical protein